MIEQSFKSKRIITPPVILNKPSQYAVFQANLRGITPHEFTRREAILQKLSLECKFQHGDTAYPVSKEGYEKFGAVLVIGVCRTMRELGTEFVWPENDNPMIITFKPSTGDGHHWCTTNYLTKRNFHLETC